MRDAFGLLLLYLHVVSISFPGVVKSSTCSVNVSLDPRAVTLKFKSSQRQTNNAMGLLDKLYGTYCSVPETCSARLSQVRKIRNSDTIVVSSR